MAAKTKARFIPPMLLLKTDALPGDASRWAYQLKVDGYRVIAFKTGGKLYVRSRNDKDVAPATRRSSRAWRSCPTRRSSKGRWSRSATMGSPPSMRCRTTARRSRRSPSSCSTS